MRQWTRMSRMLILRKLFVSFLVIKEFVNALWWGKTIPVLLTLIKSWKWTRNEIQSQLRFDCWSCRISKFYQLWSLKNFVHHWLLLVRRREKRENCESFSFYICTKAISISLNRFCEIFFCSQRRFFACSFALPLLLASLTWCQRNRKGEKLVKKPYCLWLNVCLSTASERYNKSRKIWQKIVNKKEMLWAAISWH